MHNCGILTYISGHNGRPNTHLPRCLFVCALVDSVGVINGCPSASNTVDIVCALARQCSLARPLPTLVYKWRINNRLGMLSNKMLQIVSDIQALNLIWVKLLASWK